MSEALDVARAHVDSLRERLDRAREGGQVELHLSLEHVELLVSLAEIALDSRS